MGFLTFFTAAGSFLGKVPLRVWVRIGEVLAIALAAASLFWLGAQHAYSKRDAADAVAAIESVRAEDIIVAARQSITSAVENDTRVVERKIYLRGKDIIREVPYYVPLDPDRMFGSGFRVLHDAAVQGQLPVPASLTDAAPVEAQDVAVTVTDNYTECLVWRQQVVNWQRWAREQRMVSE